MPHLMFQVCDSQPADLNGDGLLDFVAADHINAGFGYFMQDPSTSSVSFAAGQTVPFVGGGNSAGIVVDDFNFDGMPDVANSDHPGIVTVRINGTPTGAAIGDVTFPTAGETNVDLGVNHGASHGFAGIEGGLVAADINTDGKLDIATANLGLNAAMDATSSILLNVTPDPVDDGMGNMIYAPAPLTRAK
ncbi:MAG: VCBS repeat-containing protein [Rhodospirillales bacterium]|nr:VCBS repeat-containing protein [Rhodospirillales bacterium]